MIDIFLPKTDDNNKQATLKSIASQSGVARVLDFPDGPVKASQTMIAIAGQAQAPYTMIYFKEQALQMGYLSTERWLQVAETGDAAMLYSDHYNTTAEGLRKDAPVIDYQQGSLRDDFDFGSLVMIRTEVLKQAARDLQGTDYQAADGTPCVWPSQGQDVWSISPSRCIRKWNLTPVSRARSFSTMLIPATVPPR